MKTQRNFTLLSLLAVHLCSYKAIAQQKPDSIPLLKNEIGVNLIPYVLAVNTSGNHEQAVLAHVFYKRRLKEHLYGRLSLVLTNGSVTDNFNVYSNILIQNTSTYLESNSYDGKNYLQYMAGIEHRWGRKNIQQFAGMDLGYAHYKSETQTRSHTLSSSSGIVTDSTVAHYKHTNNTIGINPFYGLILGFSKHFFITAQVGLNLQLNSRSSEKIIDNRNLTYANGNITNFDLNMAGVSNHISVCYRF